MGSYISRRARGKGHQAQVQAQARAQAEEQSLAQAQGSKIIAAKVKTVLAATLIIFGLGGKREVIGSSQHEVCLDVCLWVCCVLLFIERAL